MSMIMHWDPVAPEELDDLKGADEDGLWEWLEADDRTTFDVDKAWHAVHVVLTGSVAEADGLLGQVVFGGTGLGEDQGYGPARYLTADEVTEVAHALDDLGEEGFAARVDLPTLARLEVYPGIWGRTEEAGEAEELLAYLTAAFTTLLTGFREAAWRGQAMVVICS